MQESEQKFRVIMLEEGIMNNAAGRKELKMGKFEVSCTFEQV